MNFPMHLSDFITQLRACLNFSHILLPILASNQFLVRVLRHALGLKMKSIHACVCEEVRSSDSAPLLIPDVGEAFFWVNTHTVKEEWFILRNSQDAFTKIYLIKRKCHSSALALKSPNSRSTRCAQVRTTALRGSAGGAYAENVAAAFSQMSRCDIGLSLIRHNTRVGWSW